MYVPLHLHSQYSILDATADVEAIAKKAKEFGLPACALTDHGNLYGAVDFFKACKAEGIKPIIGCEVYVAPGSRLERTKLPGQKAAHHLILLAKNATGWRNLCELSSSAFLEGFYYHPRIDKELLAKHKEGLICTSACMSSSIAQAAFDGRLDEEVRFFHDLFKDDFFIEIQRHTMSEEAIKADGISAEPWLEEMVHNFDQKQKQLNEMLIDAAQRHKIPLVATNDTHYINREDWRAHQIVLNISSGEPTEIWERDSLGNLKSKKPNPKRRVYSSHELYFKSPQQMRELFADVPEALDNTLEVAKRCNFEFDFTTKHYPVYRTPEGQTQAKYLWSLCREGIQKRYTPERLAYVEGGLETIEKRLTWEMEILDSKGMCDYILIVWDFINWAKKSGIPMGPGRGSGAGAIVCYLIGITDIEPLRFNLFFERFINPERLSYPDIDVDICMDRRQEVIDYVVAKYGVESVAQIITFGTMKAKMAIRDVGRVLNVPLSKVNEIAKLVPEDPTMTLDRALEQDADFRSLCERDSETARIIELAKKLEGCIRNTSIHAAGLIIAAERITTHLPLCNAKDSSMAVTQFSMKPVEQVGMLKIDFLGLKTLTSIQEAVNAIHKRHGRLIDWINLPLDDSETYKIINSGRTMGIFQLESGGMQELSRNLHLDRFEEIIAVLSLYRPGPMDMIPSFIARKFGKEPIEIDHPSMEPILKETYGIMVYQEQVMQIAQTLAGYSLGEGDVLRRAMGKKDGEEMFRQRAKFVEGARKNGIDGVTAASIFDKMEKFAAYGFNKSHAAAYGFLTYVTAYLKAHYPADWMAALLTSDHGDITKVAKFLREAQEMGIAILPPDINEASDRFSATASGIRFAMTAVKGLGEAVVQTIIAERSKGPYTSLLDFMQRVAAPKKAVELLIDAGAFDFTGWSRAALQASVEPMWGQAQESARGVMTLFSLVGEVNQPPQVEERPKQEQLIREKELLGFFLTGHPMDSLKERIDSLDVVPLHKLEELPDQSSARIACILESIEVRLSKNQRKYAIARIGDGMSHFELMIWSDQLEESGALLNENALLFAVVQVKREEGAIRLTARFIADLQTVEQEAISKVSRSITRSGPAKVAKEAIRLQVELISMSQVMHLKNLFRAHKGPHPVQLVFTNGEGPLAELEISAAWGVHWSDALKNHLEQLEGISLL